MWLLTLWNKVEQRVAAWVGIGGFFLSLIGFFAWPSSVKEAIFASGLTMVFVGSGATFLVMACRLHRRARYAEAFANVREAVCKITTEDLAEFHDLAHKRHAISSAMDDLSKAFSILTGSNCRCCVKTVSRQGDLIGVVTYCRHSDYQGTDPFHPIEHNTDFNDLFQDKGKKWFVANDLPSLAKAGNYVNTNKDWQTNYRSTVIWPLRRGQGLPDEWPELLGFLCVDSKRTRAFSEEYDYPVGALVADALCSLLMRGAIPRTKAKAPEPKPESLDCPSPEEEAAATRSRKERSSDHDH